MKLSTRLMLAMVALALMSAAIVGGLATYSIEQITLRRVLGGLEYRVRLPLLELEAAVRSSRGDALGFASAVAVDGIVRASAAGGTDPANGNTVAQWRDRLAARFVAELSAKTNYLMFRIIGVADGGREILRVDRSGLGSAIRITPPDELQQQQSRDYFQRAIRLAPGEVDVSPVELNRSRGTIDQPLLPVLRVATPIHAPDGKLFGFVIINVDLRDDLERLRSSDGIGQVYLVNERGDYLINPDRSREFGFEFGRPQRVQDDFPELADVIARRITTAQLTRDRSGGLLGAGLSTVRLAQSTPVTMLLTWPYSRVIEPAMAVRNATIIAGIATALIAIGLAVLLARSLTRPLRRMTAAVEAFGRGEPMAVPSGAHGEIGILAGAFSRMADDVGAKTAELRRNAETFEGIMNSMADGLLVVDEKGKTLLANAAVRAMFGERDDVGSAEWQTIYHRFHSDEVTPLAPEDTPIGRAMRGDSFDRLQLVMRREGETKSMHILSSGRPLRDAGGKFYGAVIIYRDITDERQVERQLRQSQKMDAVGQLTGGVAHDFNNILTVITGTIEILRDGVADRPQLADVARMIDEAAMRGAELTQQLLAFARRQPLQPRRVDPNALMREIAGLLRPTLGEHIEIATALEDEAWQTVADPALLTTAVLNLAVNARDAMPDGGKLTLETGNVMLDESYAQQNPEVRPGPHVMIAVSDTGTGMSQSVIDRVFEPFFTTKDVGKGTGLGLSMVYGFVKQSGGNIKVYSEEGHGTTIKIYLPRAEGEAEPVVAQGAMQIVGGSETILVVEDDNLVRDYLVAQLQGLGYATLSATQATEALALVEAGAQFDLLLTDVIMPGGMNGRQLADEIARRRPGTRVLFTSGYTENAIVHHGRLDPGVALLNKPYRKKDLAEKVRQVLDAPRATS